MVPGSDAVLLAAGSVAREAGIGCDATSRAFGATGVTVLALTGRAGAREVAVDTVTCERAVRSVGASPQAGVADVFIVGLDAVGFAGLPDALLALARETIVAAVERAADDDGNYSGK